MSKRPGSIWYVRVAFRENPEIGKRRPVVYIGHDAYAALVLAVTSKLHHPSSYILQDWEFANLGKPSAVRLDAVINMSDDDLIDYVGELSKRDFENLKMEFRLVQLKD